MKGPYIYWVSVTSTDWSTGATSVAATEVFTESPIDSGKKVKAVGDTLEEKLGMINAVVTFFTLLRVDFRPDVE